MRDFEAKDSQSGPDDDIVVSEVSGEVYIEVWQGDAYVQTFINKSSAQDLRDWLNDYLKG